MPRHLVNKSLYIILELTTEGIYRLGHAGAIKSLRIPRRKDTPLGTAGATKLSLVTFLIIMIVAVTALAAYSYPSLNKSTSSIYYSQTTSSLDSNMSVLNQTLASLAYAHWTSIAQKNVSAVMSQYSPAYESLYWFGNGNAILGLPNGKYDCNVPSGQNNCSPYVRSAWQHFFDNVSSPMQLSACGFNIVGTAQQPYRIDTSANVTFFLVDSNETIFVHYGIDFQNVNGQWYVQRDWFGFPFEFATLHPGNLPPTCK